MDRIKKFFERDLYAKLSGIELVDVKPGYAIAKMDIKEHHYNGVRIVHGGAIFTLADFAFAVASNTDDNVAVSIHSDIAIYKGISTGTLIAEAKEINKHPKLGSYQVEIKNEKGEMIALFNGIAYRKSEKKSLIPPSV